jgi:alpha-L-fucosidase
MVTRSGQMAQPNYRKARKCRTGPRSAPGGNRQCNIKNGTLELNGRLLKKGNADSLQLYFEYRPFAGFAENLYSKDWLKTTPVVIRDTGNFTQLLPPVEAGKEYQYRAVIIHPRLTVRGDVKRMLNKK